MPTPLRKNKEDYTQNKLNNNKEYQEVNEQANKYNPRTVNAPILKRENTNLNKRPQSAPRPQHKEIARQQENKQNNLLLTLKSPTERPNQIDFNNFDLFSPTYLEPLAKEASANVPVNYQQKYNTNNNLITKDKYQTANRPSSNYNKRLEDLEYFKKYSNQILNNKNENKNNFQQQNYNTNNVKLNPDSKLFLTNKIKDLERIKLNYDYSKPLVI